MRPTFLVGLDFEAAILRQAAGTLSPLIAIARQGDAAATRARLERQIAAGADAVVSFGVAGALDPSLEPGALVLAETVIDIAAGTVFATDEAWRLHLVGRGSAVPGALAGVASPITTPAEKTRLYGETGAVAVDMESQIAGLAAAAAGLPFLVVRAIADDAGQSLPQAALAGVDAEGRVRPLSTLAALAGRPGELAGLIHLGRATQKARRRLADFAPQLVGGG